MDTNVIGFPAGESRQKSSPIDLDDFFENGAVCLHSVDADGVILAANRAELELLGYSADEYVGRRITEFHVDADTIADILARLSAEQRLTSYPARLRARDGTIKHVLITSSVKFADAAFINSRCFSVDVTAAVEAEAARREAEKRLRESERRSRELLEALPMAVYTTDARGKITYFNEAAVRMAGRRPRLGEDEWCVSWKLYWPDGAPLPHDQCPMATAIRTGKELRGVEAVLERPDGERKVFTPFPTLLRDHAGEVIGAVNVLVDITALKRADEQQKLLIDELNHRVKNTLATVQSISLQTHRSSPDAFIDRFEDRLMALSRTHNLLTDRQWDRVELTSLIDGELAPYADGRDGAVLRFGPKVDLSARESLAVGMVLHELATNAAKYGGLSTPGGKVSIGWNVEEAPDKQRLCLRWVEQGGPVVRPPSRRGFGRRLIERSIAQELQGEVELAFEPEGLDCRMRFALTSNSV